MKSLQDHLPKKKLGKILSETGLVGATQIKEALKIQSTLRKKLGDALVDFGYLTQDQLYEILSQQFNLPIASLNGEPLQKNIQNLFPAKYAQNKKIIVFGETNNGNKALKVGISEPTADTITEIFNVAKGKGYDPEIYLVRPDEIEYRLNQLYAGHNIKKGIKYFQPQAAGSRQSAEVIDEQMQGLATIFLDEVIEQAIDSNASDIHFESTETGGAVKLRIDGLLRSISMSKEFASNYDALISRIKVLTNSMKIHEKVIPQDGSFSVQYDAKDFQKIVDFRVSTIRSNFGEDIVIRLLDQEKANISLNELGFSKPILDCYNCLIRKPEGMIIVTGPTGSGKSTTLYATLNSLIDPRKKIMTAEDPIEYTYKNNVRQSEVNPARGVYFHTLLKAFLRQDPDILLVGEIRDEETARTALKAVQTGHMLLSTLHTQDTTRSIGRLKELNVDPATYLTYTTGIMGQRLVRKVCPNCKEKYTPRDEEVREYFGKNVPNFQFYHGAGCEKCDFSGYSGRTAVNELWDIQKNKISGGTYDSSKAREIAIENGMHTFYLDGIHKLKVGQTTIEQLLDKVPNINEDMTFYGDKIDHHFKKC